MQAPPRPFIRRHNTVHLAAAWTDSQAQGHGHPLDAYEEDEDFAAGHAPFHTPDPGGANGATAAPLAPAFVHEPLSLARISEEALCGSMSQTKEYERRNPTANSKAGENLLGEDSDVLSISEGEDSASCSHGRRTRNATRRQNPNRSCGNRPTDEDGPSRHNRKKKRTVRSSSPSLNATRNQNGKKPSKAESANNEALLSTLFGSAFVPCTTKSIIQKRAKQARGNRPEPRPASPTASILSEDLDRRSYSGSLSGSTSVLSGRSPNVCVSDSSTCRPSDDNCALVPGITCVGCALGPKGIAKVTTFVNDHAKTMSVERDDALWHLAADVYRQQVFLPCQREGLLNTPEWPADAIWHHYLYHELNVTLTAATRLREMRAIREMLTRRMIRYNEDLKDREIDCRTLSDYLKVVQAEDRATHMLQALEQHGRSQVGARSSRPSLAAKPQLAHSSSPAGVSTGSNGR